MRNLVCIFFAGLLFGSNAAFASSWDSTKNRSSCLLHLGANVESKLNPEVLMENVRHATSFEVSLPYYMAKTYNTQLLPISLQSRSSVNFKVYLGYSKGQEIIPVFGHVESWHALTRVLDGYHITLGFESSQARKAFLEETHYHAQVTEGEITHSNEKKEFLVALTFDQFETLQVAYPNLFGINMRSYVAERTPIDVQVKPSNASELQRLSSEVVEGPRGRGSYYFRGSEAVGYRTQDNQYFRIHVTHNGLPQGANSASHAEIVKRQMAAQGIVLDVAAMRNPKSQLIASRRLLDQSLALLKVKVPRPWLGPTSLDIEGHIKIAQNLLSEKKSKSLELNEALAAIARQRYLESSSRIREARDFNLPLYDLPKLKKGLAAYKNGEANSTRTLTFVGIKGQFLEDNLYVVHGELLHDNIGRLLVGDLFDNPQVLAHHFIGGNVQIHYDDRGRAVRFTMLKNSMLVTAGERKLSRVELSKLKSLMNDFINRPE